ncbi:MAG: hypothetical protein DMF58_06095 [Acidobacteria bacterium]|nr:MAG: hypothetical protein DMF58_06095 [Acidobacteriota bacterium]
MASRNGSSARRGGIAIAAGCGVVDSLCSRHHRSRPSSRCRGVRPSACVRRHKPLHVNRRRHIPRRHGRPDFVPLVGSSSPCAGTLERNEQLLGVFVSLVELDERSHVLWNRKGRFHHDLDVASNCDIYALAWEAEVVPKVHATQPTLIDYLVVLTPKGLIKRKVSLFDVLRRSPYAFLFPSIQDLHVDGPNRELDLIHSNHVEVIGDGAPFPPGSVLLGMRNINATLVLAPSLDRILWLWGPSNLTFPHDPTLLPNGNILIFDNGTEQSQIIEMNPQTNSIVWRFAPRSGFFSAARGSVQRLPNGNTLITESDRGNAFEVTRRGRVVWRFENPDVGPNGLRGAILRMTRFAPDQLPFLQSRR